MLSHNSRLSRAIREKLGNKCGRCGHRFPKTVVVENCTGTEEMRLCLQCLNIVLNTNGVKVIKDNVGRDQ